MDPNNNQYFGNPNYNMPDAPPPAYNEINNKPYSNNANFNTYNTNTNNREEKFREIVNRHEINQFFANKLQLLNSFKIVFIFDDSGSMNSILSESPLNRGHMKVTRWDELQYFSKISIEIANVFNQNGTDVYFLNRPMIRNVVHSDQLMPCFQQKPAGYTPISRVLSQVLAQNRPDVLAEKKLLIMIVTDGEPTDDYGRVDIQAFKQMLLSRGGNTFTTIVSCTDEDQTMDYLNNWDRTIPRLDVVDDFRSEKEEIQRSQGRGFPFSFGDYVVKSMIGSVDVSLDSLDENFNFHRPTSSYTQRNTYKKNRNDCVTM